MYLLIRVCCFISEYSFFNLHPTMYLLILDNKSRITTPLLYLHPTMYLLILSHMLLVYNNQNNLHPTMYLLIPACYDLL